MLHASIASFGLILAPAALITQNKAGSDVSAFRIYVFCLQKHMIDLTRFCQIKKNQR